MAKEAPQITLADGTELPCDFFGYSASVGLQYIDIPDITVVKAARLFGDAKKTAQITFENASETVVREGFTVCAGITASDNVCRVMMRRPYAEPGDTETLSAAQAEAAQYKEALALLGIETSEVNEN